MPLITTIHESLPYIDPEPTPAQRAAAESLIAAERALVPDDPHHALLRPAHTPTFTPAIQAELARIASKPSAPPKLAAIDLSRYEAQDSLPEGSSANKAELQSALQRAYTTATYLSSRRTHLALLDSYGKNAWLVGNWQLEGELKAVEAELAAKKAEIDVLNLRRRRAQEEVGGEMTSLEESWRRGVGKVLETEIAAEELRRRVLETRRGET